MNNSPKSKAPLPEIIQEKYTAWRSIFMKHLIWNYVIGTTAIVASALAAMKAFDYPHLAPLLSGVAAIATALVTFYQLKEKASAYKAAWRLLDAKYIEHDRDRTPKTLEALYAAALNGEEIIKGADN
jgi:hypothetical protein